MSRQQASRSRPGNPSSSENTFIVPTGKIPNAVCACPGGRVEFTRARPCTASLTVPSPPAATTISCPSAASCSASSAAEPGPRRVVQFRRRLQRAQQASPPRSLRAVRSRIEDNRNRTAHRFGRPLHARAAAPRREIFSKEASSLPLPKPPRLGLAKMAPNMIYSIRGISWTSAPETFLGPAQALGHGGAGSALSPSLPWLRSHSPFRCPARRLGRLVLRGM